MLGGFPFRLLRALQGSQVVRREKGVERQRGLLALGLGLWGCQEEPLSRILSERGQALPRFLLFERNWAPPNGCQMVLETKEGVLEVLSCLSQFGLALAWPEHRPWHQMVSLLVGCLVGWVLLCLVW